MGPIPYGWGEGGGGRAWCIYTHTFARSGWIPIVGWMTRNDLPSFDLGTYVVSICFDPHGELGPGTGSSNDFGAMDFAEAGCDCGRTQCTDCALSAVSTQSNLQSQITAALQNLASSHNELA